MDLFKEEDKKDLTTALRSHFDVKNSLERIETGEHPYKLLLLKAGGNGHLIEGQGRECKGVLRDSQ